MTKEKMAPERAILSLPPSLRERINDFRYSQRIPSEASAIRQLITQALDAHEAKSVKGREGAALEVTALTRAMAEAGAPSQAIVLAMEALEARDVEDAGRRAKQADRKRRSRSRQPLSSGVALRTEGEARS